LRLRGHAYIAMCIQGGSYMRQGDL
jgi:hypothetical protein